MGRTRRHFISSAGLAAVVLLAGCTAHISRGTASSLPASHAAKRSPARKPSPPESGNTVVAEALAVVAQQTAMPLRGPEGLPGHPLSAPTWLTAAVTAVPSRYTVELLWVPKPGPPPESRSVFLSQVADPRALIPDGSFGGVRYPSTTAADAALSHNDAAFLSPPPGPPSQRVMEGVTLRVWRLPPGASLITWRENGWTMELRGPVTLAQARYLVHAIARHRLPAGPGLFAETVTRTGTTTVLDWRQGRNLYWVQAAPPTVALVMAHATVSYQQVSATLYGYQRPLPPAQVIAEAQQTNRNSPWVDLTAPHQDQRVRPGQRLMIAGQVLTHSPNITFAPTGLSVIGVYLNGGYTNPSLELVTGRIAVSNTGTFQATVRIPYELPALDGPLLGLLLQYSSHMAPVTGILLNPTGVAEPFKRGHQHLRDARFGPTVFTRTSSSRLPRTRSSRVGPPGAAGTPLLRLGL